VTDAPRRRTRRGLETRKKVENAAFPLFVERGFQGTSMQDIADAAGVHVQTLYLAYGTKAALLHETASRRVAEGEDQSVPPPERKWVREIVATDDPLEKLRLYVRHVRHIAESWAPIRDVMREARDEPDVAERLAAMEYGRYEGPLNLLPPIHRAGQMRPGLTVEKAAAITYAIASPDTFLQLRDRGMSGRQAEGTVTDILTRAILAD
jgi:AcrR family transcriptional regulator